MQLPPSPVAPANSGSGDTSDSDEGVLLLPSPVAASRRLPRGGISSIDLPTIQSDGGAVWSGKRPYTYTKRKKRDNPARRPVKQAKLLDQRELALARSTSLATVCARGRRVA